MNIKLLTTIGFLAVLIGCASPQPSSSGYLPDYARMKPTEHLEEYWADTQQIKKSVAPNISLGEVSAEDIHDKDNVTVADCLSWLRKGLPEE